MVFGVTTAEAGGISCAPWRIGAEKFHSYLCGYTSPWNPEPHRETIHQPTTPALSVNKTIARSAGRLYRPQRKEGDSKLAPKKWFIKEQQLVAIVLLMLFRNK